MNDIRTMISKEFDDIEVESPGRSELALLHSRGARHGARISIRNASSSDRDALSLMLSRCSSDTIYKRFFSPYSKVPKRMISLLLDTDHPGKRFLLATATDDDGEQELVAHAMYARVGDSSRAEMAIVVEDGWQSMGVGRMLLGELAEDARHRGVESFVGTVMYENPRMLGMIERLFPGSSRAFKDGAYEFLAPLSVNHPTPAASEALRNAA